METRTVRISKRVYDAVSSTQRPGQSFAGALDEVIDAGAVLTTYVDGARGACAVAGPSREWIRFVYPMIRDVGPWFSASVGSVTPVARQWVQRGGFGPKPGPIRSLIVSGDPTAEEVAKCEQWLAAESDRISAVEKETNKCP